MLWMDQIGKIRMRNKNKKIIDASTKEDEEIFIEMAQITPNIRHLPTEDIATIHLFGYNAGHEESPRVKVKMQTNNCTSFDLILSSNGVILGEDIKGEEREDYKILIEKSPDTFIPFLLGCRNIALENVNKKISDETAALCVIASYTFREDHETGLKLYREITQQLLTKGFLTSPPKEKYIENDSTVFIAGKSLKEGFIINGKISTPKGDIEIISYDFEDIEDYIVEFKPRYHVYVSRGLLREIWRSIEELVSKYPNWYIQVLSI